MRWHEWYLLVMNSVGLIMVLAISITIMVQTTALFSKIIGSIITVGICLYIGYGFWKDTKDIPYTKDYVPLNSDKMVLCVKCTWQNDTENCLKALRKKGVWMCHSMEGTLDGCTMGEKE